MGGDLERPALGQTVQSAHLHRQLLRLMAGQQLDEQTQAVVFHQHATAVVILKQGFAATDHKGALQGIGYLIGDGVPHGVLLVEMSDLL